jgi:peptidoglycan endopeptidase LytF
MIHSGVSQQYGCMLDSILAVNPGVVPEQLQIGQIVYIPSHRCHTYTIKSGDTLWLLSQRYRCELNDIFALNPGIVPEQLQIGQIIHSPNRT